MGSWGYSWTILRPRAAVPHKSRPLEGYLAFSGRLRRPRQFFNRSHAYALNPQAKSTAKGVPTEGQPRVPANDQLLQFLPIM